jgi:hypothetical protein
MILYLAGPMTGKSFLNYPAFFRAEETLKVNGFDVLNPARIDEQYPTECMKPQRIVGFYEVYDFCKACAECNFRTWQWYMRKAVAMLLQADGVALLPEWTESRGAKVEVKIADCLEMESRPWQDWIRFSKQETVMLDVEYGN